MNLSPGYTILVTVILAAASFVHGMLGFGYPFISTPLIAMFTDVRSAMLILVLPTMALNMFSIIQGGHAASALKRFWPLALCFAMGSLVGTRLLIVANPEPFKVLLAVTILFYLQLQKKGVRIYWIMHHQVLAMLLLGMVGGFIAGLVNGAIPVLIIFTLEIGLSPLVSIVVFNLCFLSGKLTQAVVFVEAGMLNGSMLKLAIPLTIVSLVGLMIGTRIRKRVDTERYRRWLRKTLFVLATILLTQYVYNALRTW